MEKLLIFNNFFCYLIPENVQVSFIIFILCDYVIDIYTQIILLMEAAYERNVV
jgi:hypothetical protein